MSLEAVIAELVAASNRLTDEVIARVSFIEEISGETSESITALRQMIEGLKDPASFINKSISDSLALAIEYAARSSKIVALGDKSGPVQLDLSKGGVFSLNCTGNITFSVTGLEAGQAGSLTLVVSNPNAGALTMPAGATFDRNAAPILTGVTKTVFVLETYDNGVSWCASQVWRNA